jgi:translocation and assembly module TamB
MSKTKKILLWAGGGILGLIMVLLVAGIVIVQTDWFRNMVRQKIIAAVEDGTGGRAEIGSFEFDWTHLRAKVRNFVLHGLEPATEAPLARADLLQVDLKLLSPFRGFVDIAYLLLEKPQVNVIVSPDGRTNVPAPKVPGAKSDKTALQTVVDLAIGKFDLRNGNIKFADRKNALNASGENLRAQIGFNLVNQRYTGEIDMSPLYVNSLHVDVKLPLTLEKDRIGFDNAWLRTPKSEVRITGAMEHLAAPRTNAHVIARVALDEAKQIAALGIPLDTVHGPSVLNADVTASMDDAGIRVQNAKVNLGQTNIEASGSAKQVQFDGTLALGELGKLFRVAGRPEGTAHVGGSGRYNNANDYQVTANLDARNLAFHQGTTQIAGVSLASAVRADANRIDLNGMRLGALGGTLTGNGSVEQLDRFKFSGELHNFDIDQVARAMTAKPLGYDGVVTGPVQAEGSIKNPSAVVAHAGLGITPGRRGVPVSGRLNVDYNGRADTVTLAKSYLTLPHTRIDLSGGLGQRIEVRAVSRDLGDLRPVAGDLPVKFGPAGNATVTATVTGKLSAPHINGTVLATNFTAEGRPFTRLATDFDASKSGASVSNGVLTHGPLQANFAAAVGLRNWKLENSGALRADATVRNADVQDVLALAGQAQAVPVTGALTVDAHVNGTVSDPQGTADITVVKGSIEGERFDSLAAHAVMTQGSIDVPTLAFVAGPSRVDANASYRHAPNDLKHGTFRVHVASNQVQLAQFQQLVKDRPGLAGALTLNADVTGQVAAETQRTEVQLTALTANASVRGLQMEGKRLGDLTATANTAGQTVQYNVNSDFAGSTIRVNGRSLLTGKHDTTANLQIANLPIDRVLAVAGRRDLPVSGTFSATGDVSGTLDAPQANVNLTVVNGKAYDEPFSRLAGNIAYTNQSIRVTNMLLAAGASSIELTASLEHPVGDLQDGRVTFHVRSNQIQLGSLHAVQQAKPGLTGVAEIVADGAATLRKNAAPLFSALNANVGAHGLALEKKPLGDLTATAQTQGKQVLFALNSNFARSTITGNGRMELGGDYPVDAQVKFANVTYSGLNAFLQSTVQTFDGSLDGEVSVSGPVGRTQDLRGTLQLTKLEAHSVATGVMHKPRVNLELHNDGPIVASLDRGQITVRSAKIAGPSTNLVVTGTASIVGTGTVNLRVDGNVKLDALEALSPDIFSSGAVTLNAAVTGSTAKPVINGRLELQNASFNMVDLPNGISNANGVVAFNGTEAVIQNLNGETGGGKISLSGFASYGGPEMQFRVQARANRIRVAYPTTITTETSANLSLAGTSSRSLLSGTVTIQDVALHSHSDMGSFFNSAAAPPQPQSVSSGILAGMRFDVKIQTSPDVQFRTGLTENLQATANLTLRGDPDHPGMLGRVQVTEGDVVFSGTKYTIDQGTVTFYNPNKIEPILNLDLETTVQGVDVSLTVSGPVDRLKLSYRSDPPLQFTEIVSLLGSGKAPTSDPVLAARAPTTPQQSLGQSGASTLLGAAVANPVSGRLQRLFGVSKLKIDPQITGASNTPQATLTLQQQISRDITFTYIQDVTQSNSQIIRVEWAINPQWSAIALRDQNGQFDVDLFYKKRFW